MNDASHRSGSQALPGDPSRPAPRRNAWGWPVGVVVAVVGLAVTAAVVLYAHWMGETTVTITNVGDQPIERIVLLAVAEGGEEVRRQWPLGELRPGVSRTVEGVFHPDTNLAVRLQTVRSDPTDFRLRIYLGSPSTSHVTLDLTKDGVFRARRTSGSGSEYVLEREGIWRGLRPRP